MRKAILLAIVLALLTVLPVAASEPLESYTIGDDTSIDAESRWHFAQTFTPRIHAIADGLSLKLYRLGEPGIATVSIKSVDGVPSGEDLTSGNIDGNTLTTDTNGEWYSIVLNPCPLEAERTYAIVLQVPEGNVTNSVWWRLSNDGNYQRGMFLYSGDYGNTWEPSPKLDFMFEVTGYLLRGDVNNDGKVNVLDMIRVGQHWGETGSPGWILEDVKEDGRINVQDMILIGQNWTDGG